VTYHRLFNFEQALSEYTNAPYVVVTDCCTHAIELCLRYDDVRKCKFTAYTYLSIPMTMRKLAIEYELLPEYWQGEYQFHNTRIWDSARRLERNMYRPRQMQCLSFGHTKPLELGKVGAILLDDEEAYIALSKMRSDGRDLRDLRWEDQITLDNGYHYCPTLEDCGRGLVLLPQIKPQCQKVDYPDCRKIIIRT